MSCVCSDLLRYCTIFLLESKGYLVGFLVYQLHQGITNRIPSCFAQESLDAALEPLLLQQKFKQGGTEMIKVLPMAQTNTLSPSTVGACRGSKHFSLLTKITSSHRTR